LRYYPRMLRQIKLFLRSDRGATAIEYSIIAGGIAVAIIVTVYSIGPKLNTTFSSVSSQLK
jgi:pilus assembly protein Flp/PilA